MRLSIRVVPRASKNKLTKLADGTYKLHLTAPPVEGAANAALVDFLSTELKVAKSSITILKGQTSKNKIIEII